MREPATSLETMSNVKSHIIPRYTFLEVTWAPDVFAAGKNFILDVGEMFVIGGLGAMSTWYTFHCRTRFIAAPFLS